MVFSVLVREVRPEPLQDRIEDELFCADSRYAKKGPEGKWVAVRSVVDPGVHNSSDTANQQKNADVRPTTDTKLARIKPRHQRGDDDE